MPVAPAALPKAPSVGFITHEDLRALCTHIPRITAAFRREPLIDSAVFRKWVTNVGRHEGTSRMAHILCELLVRLRAVGLVEDHFCHMPLSQSRFADVLGFTTVHVKRILQQLRAEGLIELEGDQLNTLDREKLKVIGEFDLTYLHLEFEEAVE